MDTEEKAGPDQDQPLGRCQSRTDQCHETIWF